MKSPLDGIKVLDLTAFQNGPWGTAMLSDMGADIIKIEDPVNGDPGRNVVMGPTPKPLSTYFQTMNRNKRAMTLDLKTRQGREVFHTMAKTADVIVQNFRVGVVERLGVDYETIRRLNPRIVYASVSGFGSRGPDAKDGVFDILGLARSGMMTALSVGDPELNVRSPGAMADQMGGVILAYGVLLGIIARERHGVGQHVEVSQLSGQLVLQAWAINGYLLNGDLPKRRSRKEANNPLWNIYRCGDGRWIALGNNPSDRFWPGACKALGIERLIDDPRSRDFKARAENAQYVIEVMDQAFLARTRDEWVKVLKAHGLFCSPVQDYPDLARDPQLIANDYLVDVPHPTLGNLREVGLPVRLSETPGAVRSSAPEYGQHTEEVLLEHGFTWEQIAELRDLRVIL